MTSARGTMMMAIVASIGALGIAGARAPVSTQAPPPAAEPPLDVAWQVPLTTRDVSGLAASKSTVFVTTPESTLAFSAADGSPVWTKAPGSEVAPVIEGENLAIITSTAVHVLGSDGGAKWRADVTGVFHAVLAGSDLILVAGRTVARWSNGKELWRLSLHGDPAAAPVLDAASLYVGIKPATVDVIDPVKGQTQASLRLPADPDALGPAPDRLMVCTSEGNSAGSLSSYKSGRRPSLDWTYPLIRCIGAPASDNKQTYTAFMDNTVRAFNTGSGHQKWTGRLPTRPFAGPIRFPNSIVVPLATGTLAEFTLEGKPVGAGTRPASLPSLLRMLAAATPPDRTRVFTTGSTSEFTGGRLLVAWARPSAKKTN